MNDWIPFDELVISEKENCITVDTRDFHCISNKIDMTKVKGNYYEKYNSLIDLINDNKIPYECLINENEIIPFINKLKNIRDEANIIMLRFNNVIGGASWIKYVRFYRKGVTSTFIVTNNCIPLYWKEINKDNLIKLF